MSRRRKPRFDQNDERPPKPLPEGRLEPPRRDPPTAVGTATPRQPSQPYRPTRYGRGVTRVERTARGFLGTLLVAGGGAAMALGPASVMLVVGALMSVGGAVVTYRVLRAPSVFRTERTTRRSERRRKRPGDGDTSSRDQRREGGR